MPLTTAERLKSALARATGPGGSSDFDLNPWMLPPDAAMRPAGVLLAVTPGRGVLLTKRSSQLRHHPGQIAFPGGKVDPGDQGEVGAALREAEEEIGLPRDAVEVLGTLPPHRTGTGFSMTPVVAVVTRGFDPVAEAGEVDEVFEVPLEHVLNRGNYSIQSRIWCGEERRYYAVPWGPYYIWGATARIFRELAERMAR